MSDWIRNQAPRGTNGTLGPLQLAWIGDAVWELHQRLRHGAKPGRSDELHRAELATIEASTNIENGANISQALKNTGEFPSVMIQLLSTGEETGEIDTLSLKASEFYTKQVNASVDRLTSIIEPLLIILVGGVIGIIVVATYLPIFHFGTALSDY